MLENFNIDLEIVDAMRFVVELPPRPKYDEEWLIICNNVREHDELLNCYNISDSNDVVVVCRKEAMEYCKEWLGWRGQIHKYYPVPCLIPTFDSSRLCEADCRRLLNLEFAPVREEY